MALQHNFFFFRGRIGDAKLHQEAIQLRFRQRISTFEIDRILGGEDGKCRRKRITRSVDRYLPFLHALQQRRLRSRRHAVDLVDQQEAGKDRPLVQHELLARAAKHIGAQNVSGHKVGRRLHSMKFQPQHLRQQFDHQRFGDTGDAFDQGMPPAEGHDQRLIDEGVLAGNDLAQLRLPCCSNCEVAFNSTE